MLPKITIPPHLLHLMICNAKHWRRPNELLKRTTWTYSKKTSQTPQSLRKFYAIFMRIQRYFKTQKNLSITKSIPFLKSYCSVPNQLQVFCPYNFQAEQ